MSRPLAILRPEPGNAATAARVESLGHIALRVPLFAIRPLAWRAPPAGDHDALILTSANAVRHGGVGLQTLLSLPVYAVGQATAEAARALGFAVANVGRQGAESLLDSAISAGITRALHLGGQDRAVPQRSPVTRTEIIYAAEILPVDGAVLIDSVVLLHSPRAAATLAKLPVDKGKIRIACLSAAVAQAAGTDWAATAIAARPDDEALIAAAITLAD